MTPEQFKEVIEVVKVQVNETTYASVKEHVNGHIKRLTERLDTYIQEDTQWKKDDKEWKDSAQPTVNLGSKVLTGSVIFKWILITGASIGGFLASIKVIKEFFFS